MRADRLISLLFLLQDHKRLTVADLAARLEVSARTVLRDVDALSGLGIPVYTDRGRSGGIRLLAGYSLRAAHAAQGCTTDLNALSPIEAEALALVSTPSVVAGLGLEKPLATALEKITAAVPNVHQLHAQHARHRLLFDTSPWFRRSQAAPVLQRLRSAVWADQIVKLDYERADGALKRYRAKPYALVAKVDVWYLVADTARGMRVFRVPRIVSAEATREAFVRDASFDLHRFWEAWCKRFEADPGNVYIVEMWLTPDGKKQLLERYGAWHAAPLEKLDADATRSRVMLDFEKEDFAVRALIELGAEARIVRPRALRRKLATLARDLLKACTAPC